MTKLNKNDLIEALKNAHAKQSERSKPIKSTPVKSTSTEKPITLERLAIAICKSYEKRMKTKF